MGLIEDMAHSNNLTKEQKESIFLLQIGTFLEYFDLMLYVHMAVLLNELFLPKTDPKMSAVLTAFAFCSTYVLRPFGALIFGYIGDNYGRKPTVIITTSIMAISCFLMANLPTYAEIGITAAIMVSVLRILQGMSSMGEKMGAMIYVTEITKPPIQYPAVNSIAVAGIFGTMAALAIATLATRTGFNWRIAFWFGSGIALIGVIARTHLRETPDFANANLRMKRAILSSREHGLEKPAELLKSINPIFKEKLNPKKFFYFLSIYCGWPLCFYLTYIYFVPTLKNSFSYSSQDIILHNFILSIVNVALVCLWSILSKKIYPLFISKTLGFLFTVTIIVVPFVLNTHSIYSIYIVQFLCLIGLPQTPSTSILIKHFPVFKRFTAATFGYALSRAVMYILISFGLVYLTEWFGYYGIWAIGFPVIFLWIRAIFYYESLEKDLGNYPLEGEWQVR